MSADGQPLEALQGWMMNALVFPGMTPRDEVEQVVAHSARLNGDECLAIYQRSYYLRILKCMREQFPALCHALGEELFTDFAREYLRAHPPESYTLYDLGRRFPGYLAETRPDRDAAAAHRESWIDFMIDLATFERQVFVMFDAPGHEGKPFAGAGVADNQLRLQPCFALGAYQFPVAWYYHEVRKGNDPQFPPHETSFVALVRKDYLTRTLLLSQSHYIFLTALAESGSVEHAISAVARQLAVPPDDVRQSWWAQDGIRQRWIKAGFFICAGSGQASVSGC